MYKVKINKHSSFDIEDRDKGLTVNGNEINLDISTISAAEKHVLFNNKSFNVSLVELNKQERTCKIKVNGEVYEANVEDQFDQLLKQLGMDNLAASKVLDVKAPMPGLVLKVLVEEGSEIKKGDNLLVLEAMKMENILKSATDGLIKKIMVKQGDKVEKNQILIQFG